MTAGCLNRTLYREGCSTQRFLISSWHSCTEKRLFQLFSAIVAAVYERWLEQLLAAGDSRVLSRTLYREGCSAQGFLFSSWHSFKEKRLCQLFSAIVAAVYERWLEQLLAAGDSRVLSRTLYREGCSAQGFLFSSWHSFKEKRLCQLFSAIGSCIRMEVRTAARSW